MEAQFAAETEGISADSHGSGAGELSDSNALIRTGIDESAAVNTASSSTILMNTSQINANIRIPILPLLEKKSQRNSIYSDYDKNRRSRTFIPHWAEEYPWVEYNEEKLCMFCKYCCEYQRVYDEDFTNSFVQGSANFRLDSVKAHANSAKHKQVARVMEGGQIPPVCASTTWKPSGAGGSRTPQKKPPSRIRSDSGRLRIGAYFDSDDPPTMCPLPRKLLSSNQSSDGN